MAVIHGMFQELAPHSHPSLPALDGSTARYEAETIGATSVAAALVGRAGGEYLELRADANCWVAIGPAASVVAVAGAGLWFAADDRRVLAIREGHTFAVIEP